LRHRRDDTQPRGDQSDRPRAFGSTSSPLLFARFDHRLFNLNCTAVSPSLVRRHGGVMYLGTSNLALPSQRA
jgi:hypothetical protein